MYIFVIMQQQPKFLLVALGALLLLAACRPEDPLAEPPPFEQIWACHQRENLDSLSVRNAMIGEWNWHYTRCQDRQDLARTEGSPVVFLRIDPDSISLWPENSRDPIYKSAWRLERRNENLFRLITEPLVVAPDLDAQVLVCDEWLVFNRSYRTDCDLYYRARE